MCERDEVVGHELVYGELLWTVDILSSGVAEDLGVAYAAAHQ